mgnify:CR=1 FL=1
MSDYRPDDDLESDQDQDEEDTPARHVRGGSEERRAEAEILEEVEEELVVVVEAEDEDLDQKDASGWRPPPASLRFFSSSERLLRAFMRSKCARFRRIVRSCTGDTEHCISHGQNLSSACLRASSPQEQHKRGLNTHTEKGECQKTATQTR